MTFFGPTLIASAFAFAVTLGDPVYSVRKNATERLMAMPWSEPLVKHLFNATLETKMRSKAVIRHWQQEYAPRKGWYILQTAEPIRGYIYKTDGDEAYFIFTKFLNGWDERSSVLIVNWKNNKLSRLD